MPRAWWWLVGAAAVALVGVVIYALLQSPLPAPPSAEVSPSPGATPTPRPTATPAPRVPSVRVDRTTISTVDPRGQRQWDIRADSVAVDGDANRVSLSAVDGAFYERGAVAVEFTAPEGTFDIATRNLTLAGGVAARTTTGRTLTAEVVRWVPREQRLEATGNVVLRQGQLVVRADRLVSDTALQRPRASGNVRVTATE